MLELRHAESQGIYVKSYNFYKLLYLSENPAYCGFYFILILPIL